MSVFICALSKIQYLYVRFNVNVYTCALLSIFILLFFREVIGHVRSLDQTRLVTFVCNKDFYNDLAVSFKLNRLQQLIIE